MSKVITYQLAYMTTMTVDLCAKHTGAYEYPLGPVQHGLHRGTCAVCEAEAAKRPAK